MKIRRNQIILIVALMSAIAWFYVMRREGYDSKDAKADLIKYVESTTETDTVFVANALNELRVGESQAREIILEADKGDEADKSKLIELIKKI